MKLVLGIDILLENPLDALHRRSEFKVSRFKLVLYLKGTSACECEHFIEVGPFLACVVI
jgi:hypothetical protein